MHGSVLRYTEDVDRVFTKNNSAAVKKLGQKNDIVGLLVEYLSCDGENGR